MAVFSLATPSVRSRVVVVMTYCGGAIRLIWSGGRGTERARQEEGGGGGGGGIKGI